MQSAKFWTYHNGAVKIKIRAGETLRHWTGGPTDEGWSSESNVWQFDGDTVTVEWCSDGRDCDGRLTQYGEAYCTIADLAAGNQCDGVSYPAWQHGAQGQRDYSAEAAGY